jgi:splicing factor 3B subunit 1
MEVVATLGASDIGERLDTLVSIIAAEGATANVVGMTQMNLLVKDLLLRTTPILHNCRRHPLI